MLLNSQVLNTINLLFLLIEIFELKSQVDPLHYFEDNKANVASSKQPLFSHLGLVGGRVLSGLHELVGDDDEPHVGQVALMGVVVGVLLEPQNEAAPEFLGCCVGGEVVLQGTECTGLHMLRVEAEGKQLPESARKAPPQRE